MGWNTNELEARFSLQENTGMIIYLERVSPHAHSDLGTAMFEAEKGNGKLSYYGPNPTNWRITIRPPKVFSPAGRSTIMSVHRNILIRFLLLMLIASLVHLYISKPQKPKSPNPACANMDITGIKEGLIVNIEDKGRIVYMSKDWDLIPMEEKEKVGFWLALCRSPNERVELREAQTKMKIREFVIDLHYKMSHGLPINP